MSIKTQTNTFLYEHRLLIVYVHLLKALTRPIIAILVLIYIKLCKHIKMKLHQDCGIWINGSYSIKLTLQQK